MARTATIQARVEPETKSEAQKILGALNISLSEAISLYLKQIIFHKGIPFELKIPTEVTARTLEKAETGQDIDHVSGVKELFEELDA